MIKEKLPDEWKEIELGEVLDYEQPTSYLVNSEEYDDGYKTPVLTAGKSFLLGHTNETEGIYTKLPVIIFDDFTTASQFVTFPFKVKSSAMKLLTPKTRDIDLKYIFWLMQTIKVDAKTHKRYYLSKYQHIKIPLPPLSTQKKIVSILEKAEKAKEWRKEADTLTKDLLKSVFLEMFDNYSNPKKRDYDELRNHIKYITSGSRGWAKYYSKDGDIFIRIQNVRDGNIDLTDIQYVKAPNDKESERTKVQEGDLLISITADLGRTGVVDRNTATKKAHINQHLVLVRLDKNTLDPIFVSHFLESELGRAQFRALDQKGVKSGLNFDSIKSLKLFIPPIKLQQKFASIVGQVEALKEHQKHSKENIDNLFGALMQKAFTGELIA